MTNHAVDRWNERIGPLTVQSFLEGMLAALWSEPDRILFLDNHVGVIDHEIVFTFEISKHKMIVTTFYGRISLHPALQSVTEWGKLTDGPKDMLNLTVPMDVVVQQLPPLVSCATIWFSGRKYMYKLEKYLYDSDTSSFLCGYHSKFPAGYQVRVFLTTYLSTGLPVVKEIRPGGKLGKSVISAYRLMNMPLRGEEQHT
ncbi:hypothetical protein ACFQPF_15590 [Fictibacillus iocasae]|uniref:DUF4166 domain-containing protein n=1 Tax=Fictibacillus iocasae TaxID=2715437 RepID=A0ABW2NUZ1_9BACL